MKKCLLLAVMLTVNVFVVQSSVTTSNPTAGSSFITVSGPYKAASLSDVNRRQEAADSWRQRMASAESSVMPQASSSQQPVSGL